MERIVLQPASSSQARANFRNTVEQPVPLGRILEAFPEDERERLTKLYPKGAAPVWGVTPGHQNRKAKKWRRIDFGDVVLFLRDSRVFASSSVTLTIRSRPLALDLWETRGSTDETWEYVYLLNPEILEQDIPYEQFNVAVGYKPNFTPRASKSSIKRKASGHSPHSTFRRKTALTRPFRPTASSGSSTNSTV